MNLKILLTGSAMAVGLALSTPAFADGTPECNDGPTAAFLQTECGTNSNATGFLATAIGYATDATQTSATALGYDANALGQWTTAVGAGTNAVG